MEEKIKFNQNAFNILGGQAGCRALADSFYEIMQSQPEAQIIRQMHPADLGPTCENFSLFLSGWLGGPPLYKEKFGSLNLTGLHALLKINEEERDIWLSCMAQAIEKQPLDKDFKKYLKQRFKTPADKICNWCQQQLLNTQNSGIGKINKTF